jgi:predicted polyphosphate/ATP-dependent NAD kinase
VTRAGLIVNPVAGIGGRYALKGSDDTDAVARIVALGARPVAAVRAERALRVLRAMAPEAELLAPAGAMGADAAERAGCSVSLLDHRPGESTSAADTKQAAAELLGLGVDLVVFAGGDGTARDVVDVVGSAVPVLGIPSGVKMRSGVFGTTPEAAGDAAGRYLASPARWPLADAEVLDAGDGGLESDLFALARVPSVPGRLQHGKSSRAASYDAALSALCDDIARELEPGRLYLFGPGTTTGRVMQALGLEPSMLGVDAVRDGALAGADLAEAGILELLSDGVEATIVLGVIGGQGFLLGRGNQQISSSVVRRVGAGNVMIVAAGDKVSALDPPVLHVDLGDGEEDRFLDGYRQVRVAPGRSIMLRLTSRMSDVSDTRVTGGMR